MIEKMIIRELEPRDHERLVEIALAAWAPVYASFKRILGAELFAMRHPDWQEEKKGHILLACKPDSPGTVLVAERENVVLGFVSFYPNVPRHGMAAIGNNAVHPDYQRQGIAHLMYQEVFRRLREQGIDFVTVRTGGDPSHLPAQRAYEKAGFDIALTEVEYFRHL
jgi:ribosomal protein S18 acetylase RimI-like enzyme